MAENGVGDNVNDALKNATYEQTTSTQKQFHNVVFVLGPPGSGKGTQCEKIQKVSELFEAKTYFLYLRDNFRYYNFYLKYRSHYK